MPPSARVAGCARGRAVAVFRRGSGRGGVRRRGADPSTAWDQARGPRSRHLDNHYALQQAIVGALAPDGTDPDTVFRIRAAAGACLAAMHTALVRWAEDDGRAELPDLIAKALAAAFGDDTVGAGPNA